MNNATGEAAISAVLLDFIRVDLVDGPQEIDAETALFSSRVLDSIKLLDLVNFMESEFRMKVRPMEIVMENFDSVARICGYVRRTQERGQT